MLVQDIIPTLQLAVAPMILISGIGLILLSMTNRYARIIDRSHHLMAQLNNPTTPLSNELHTTYLRQIHILVQRARIVRFGIALGVGSVLLAALLVISLFVLVLLKLSWVGLIVLEFTLCLLCMIGCLLLFLRDVNLSLRALWIEIPPDIRQQAAQR